MDTMLLEGLAHFIVFFSAQLCMLQANEIVVTTGRTRIGRLSGGQRELGWLAVTQLASIQTYNEGTALVNIFSNSEQVRGDDQCAIRTSTFAYRSNSLRMRNGALRS